MTKLKEDGDKFRKSLAALEHALKFKEKAKKDSFYLSGIAKSFEVCLEYAWKHLKTLVTEAGLDVYSPRETIKLAGRSELIDDVELWLRFLDNRNLSTHDYLGISDEEYLKMVEVFSREAKKLLKRA